MMNFNLKDTHLLVMTYEDLDAIHALIDNQGNIAVVQNELFHILEKAGEINSAGKRKRFVYVNPDKSIVFNKTQYKEALSEDFFNSLYHNSVKRTKLKLIDYDTAIKALEKHYHGPRGGLLLRTLLDNEHVVKSISSDRNINKKPLAKKFAPFTPSKHKTKDEVIDNLKQSNAKWEQAVNEKAAAYKKLTVENESLHNKLAAAAVDNDELKVRNTKLNNEVAELKSTLYDRTVDDTKKTWWQNVKGVFGR